MYHIFFDEKRTRYIQVRDTDLKTTNWSKKLLPWDETSPCFWGTHPFSDHNFLRVSSSKIPFDPNNYPELFIKRTLMHPIAMYVNFLQAVEKGHVTDLADYAECRNTGVCDNCPAGRACDTLSEDHSREIFKLNFRQFITPLISEFQDRDLTWFKTAYPELFI